MLKKKEFFLNYIVKGIIGSLILFILLFKTKVLIFSFFPLLLSVGLASKIYSARIKSYDKNLFIFLDDLKDLLLGGMNIVTALEITTKNEYGILNQEVKRLAAQTKIGIPFEIALNKTFGEVDSVMFKKVTQIISESTKVGGNVIKIFTSISNYVRTLNDMKMERKSKSFSTIFSSYFMYFIFIAIILVIQIVFLPMLTSNELSMGSTNNTPMKDIEFNNYFLYLILVQGAFAGPLIGKISEGSAIAGIKHSVILLSISVPLYVIISLLFIT